MMSYSDWVRQNEKKKNEVVDRLKKKNFTDEQIFEYFNYDNMRVKEPNFCILYKTGEKCHDIKNLNCFYCACPYFVLNNSVNPKIKSYCSNPKGNPKILKNKKKGFTFIDCSNCVIPHIMKKKIE